MAIGSEMPPGFLPLPIPDQNCIQKQIVLNNGFAYMLYKYVRWTAREA